MPENQTAMPYRDLIREAYIDPIRSAVLIDDDFPTLEEYVNGKVNPKANVPPVLKDLLQTCRTTPNHWLVDVHNGANVLMSENGSAYKHLHHSDLMILDYHLDGSTGGNEKAIKILRSLAGNNYFNLVVVYTACNGEDDLQARLKEIVCGLKYHLHVTTTVPSALTDIEDEPDIAPEATDISNILNRLFSEVPLLDLFDTPIDDKSAWLKLPHFKQIESLLLKFKFTEEEKSDILNWLWHKRLNEKREFSDIDLGTISHSPSENADRINWIRSDKLFITIIEKGTNPSLIREKLLDALAESNPSPHRLLMAKMRNCLDDSGVSAEAAIVRKENIQAGLLLQMLEAEEHDLPWKLQETINRHWEQLSTGIENDIHKYGMNLFNTVKQSHNADKYGAIKAYTEIDLKDKAAKYSTTLKLNSFICSKKAHGAHLMPGQILRSIDEITKEPSYWICLSPACDLVPNRKCAPKNVAPDDTKDIGLQPEKIGGNKNHLADKQIMPLTVVKLWPVEKPPTQKNINTNEYLFVEIDDAHFCFSYSKNPGSNPTWERLFAMNNGWIVKNKITFFSISDFDSETLQMKSKTHYAEVIAQLRYEYAINLMQKLGANLSRVGLDFISVE